MKKLLLSSFLLLAAATNYSSDRPLKTTLRTSFFGACGAGVGFGLEIALNYRLADYSLDTPTLTKEGRWLLIGLGALGVFLMGEKLARDRTTPFDNILPIADESIKRYTGKTLALGVKAITAYTILTMAAKLPPTDAAIYAAAGLGAITLIEPD